MGFVCLFVSLGRKWQEGQGGPRRRTEKGYHSWKESREEIHKLSLLASLGEMPVKSGLLKQISYFRPQDVPFTKQILFQVGPIRKKKSMKTFDAISVVTRGNNIKQQLKLASNMSSEPKLCGWSCKEAKRGLWRKNLQMLRKQPGSFGGANFLLLTCDSTDTADR